VRSLTSRAGEQPSAPETEEIQLELDGPGAAQSPPPPSRDPANIADLQTTAVPGVCRLDVAGATSSGCVRPRNEDSFLVQHLAWSNLDQHHEAAILVVADGMGGYEAGDQASGMVIRTLGGSLAGLLSDALVGSFKEGAATGRIDLALKAANRAVHQKGQTDPACKGMGATAAVTFILDGLVQVGHVGDCRVYHFRDGKLVQVTRDQTLVARMVELGQLSAAEAKTHTKRNEVTQAIGRNPDVEPAACQFKIAAGDWVVVTCDGLHAHVDEEQLATVLGAGARSAANLAHHLVALANEGGGSDNCTVLAVRGY
jgi:protein phosphatase